MTMGIIALRNTLMDPTHRTVGHPDSDVYPHLWGYWRWIRKWNDGGFAETWNNAEPFLNAPYTGDLYHVDWLNGFIVWMGTSIGMPFLMSVNAMILLQWTLMGIGAIALGKRLQLTFWPMLFIVCCLDTTPFIERFVLHSSVFERLNLGWVLLYLYCLTGLIQKQRWQYCIGGIVFFGLTVLGSWHYALFAILSSIWIASWHLVQNRSLWKPMVSLAIGCASIAYPISRRAQSSLQEGSIIEHKAQRFWDWNTPLEVLNDFTVFDLFSPTVQQSFGFDVLEESIFIGWAIPLGWLSFIAIKKLRTKGTGLWFAMSLYFTVLTLGPNITINETLTVTSPIYYATAGLVPYFSTMEVPWEYSWMALLTGAVLCALLLKHVTRYAWIASVMVLLQHQICFREPVSTTQPVPVDAQVISTLRTSSQNIFNFPLTNRNTSTAQSPHHEYLWMQTLHERPIAYGIQQSWLQQTEVWRRLNETVNTAESWRTIRQQCRLNACQNADSLRGELNQQGFTQFVLHLNFIPQKRHNAQLVLWKEIFGAPLAQSDAHVVYQIISKQ